MKIRNYLFLILIPISFFSCNKEPDKEFDTAIVEKEVKEMFIAYDDSVRKNGIEGEFFFLDNSEQFYWVPPGYKYALHYDSIAKILHEYAPNFKYINNTWDTLHIMALSDKYASFNGIINSYSVTIDNDTTTSKLSETGLVIKRGEDWKFLSGQTVIIDNE